MNNLVQPFFGHEGGITSLQFSPNGSWLLSSGRDANAIIWDAESGKIVQRLGPFVDEVLSARFMPGGARIVFAVADPSWRPDPPSDWTPLIVCDAVSGEITAGIDLDGLRAGFIEPVPGSDSVLVALSTPGVEPGGLAEVSVPGGSILRRFAEDRLAKSIAFMSGGGRFVIADHDGEVSLWDISGERVAGYKCQRMNCIGPAAVSPDGRRVAVAGPRLEILDGQSLKKLSEGPAVNTITNALAYSPDGRFLATGHGHPKMPGDYFEECHASLWDLESESEISRRPSEQPVKALAFSPDSKLIAAGDEGGVIYLTSVP